MVSTDEATRRYVIFVCRECTTNVHRHPICQLFNFGSTSALLSLKPYEGTNKALCGNKVLNFLELTTAVLEVH